MVGAVAIDLMPGAGGLPDRRRGGAIRSGLDLRPREGHHRCQPAGAQERKPGCRAGLEKQCHFWSRPALVDTALILARSPATRDTIFSYVTARKG